MSKNVYKVNSNPIDGERPLKKRTHSAEPEFVSLNYASANKRYLNYHRLKFKNKLFAAI